MNMPLMPRRVSPTISAGRKAAGSQGESRRGRRGVESPTTEILTLPENGRRVTRSRSRDEASRGRRINFYVQDIVSVPRGAKNRSREQQNDPARKKAQKSSEKGENKKKITAKKAKKTSKATQQQRNSESDWEDQPDELQDERRSPRLLQPENVPPGGLGRSPNVEMPRRSPRVLQQTRLPLLDLGQSPVHHVSPQAPRRSHLHPPNILPRELSRSPIVHVPSPVPPARDERTAEVGEPVREKKKPQKGSRKKRGGDEIVGGVEKSSATGPHVIASVTLPSTSGFNRITRRNPTGLVPATTTLKLTMQTPEDQLDDGRNTTAGDDNSESESLQKSPGKKGKKKDKLKIKIQLKQKMPSSHRDSASSQEFPSFHYEEDAEVEESLQGGNGCGTEATGAEVENETVEDLRNNSAITSRSKDYQHSTSGLEQKNPVNIISSSDEDDGEDEMFEHVEEINEYQEIAVTPESTMIQGCGNSSTESSRPMASIFDPGVSLRASDASMNLPDLPIASSTHHHENVQMDENPEPTMPPKTPGEKKILHKRVQFKSRSEHLGSIGRPATGENTSDTTGDQNTQNVPHDQSTIKTTHAKTSQKESSAGTSSVPVSEIADPPEEDNNLIFDISQISNITLRTSRSSRFSQASKESTMIPKTSKNHPTPLPEVEDIEAREESVRPINNVDVVEIKNLTKVTRPQKPPLIQARSLSAMPQYLGVEVQERRHINVNMRNSPPPIRQTIILPHNSPTWDIIEQQLLKSCFNLDSLKKIILQCHQDKQVDWKFRGLDNFFSSIEAPQSESFFYEILPGITQLALEMPELMIRNITVRQQNKTASTDISQRGVGCLLAHALFCTFKNEAGREYGGKFLNFSTLFESFEESESDMSKEKNRIVKEKFEFIISYFSTVASQRSDGPINIQRVYSPSALNWWALPDQLRPVRIERSVRDYERCIEVIDTSGLIGGDLFGFTAETEEINSLIHPELMVARLFIEPLGDDEAVFFSGVRKYSNFERSGSSFKFSGKSDDSESRDFAYIQWKNVEYGRDFEREDLIRELNKMYIVFEKVEKDHGDEKMVIVTSSQRPDDHREQILKFLIVAIAASVTKIPVTFCTPDDVLNEGIENLQELLINKKVNIQSIFTGLCEYGVRRSAEGLPTFFRRKFCKK